MPIYAPKSKISDADPAGNSVVAKELGPGVETASSYSINIAIGGAAQNVHYVTDRWLINSDNWENSGTMSCKIRATAASNMRVRCMIRRCGPGGVLLQSGTFTAFQTLVPGSTLTFTPTVPAWTSSEENCGNRLAIRFSFDAVLGASAASATIEVGTTESEITSNITENNGNCRRLTIS